MLTPDTITKLRDRLALVKHVIEHENPPAKPSAQPPGRDYAQHDSLANYLLLTCFDLLGQPADWVDLNKWLTAGECAEERAAAAATCTGLDPIENVRQVTAWYNNKYGARKAFVRGVLEVVSAENRQELIDGIHFVRDGKEQHLTEKQLADWLFKLRNGFTHGAEISGKPRMMDGTRLAYASFPDGKFLGKWG